MSIQVTRTSVHADRDWHDFYKKVTSESKRHAREIPFASMRHAFVSFACLGYAHGQYVEIDRGRRQELFIAPSFEQEHVPILVALAYSRLVSTGMPHEEAIQVVSNSNGFVPIVEGWAQGGAQIFKAALESGSPLATDVLMELVMPEVKRAI
jgi:hypothetical protein